MADKVEILGVKINNITLDQAADQVIKWIKEGGKHYISTPNIEFIILAQRDDAFRTILNQSDIAIPDSSRLGWAYDLVREKNPLLKILKWPFFIFPKFFNSLPTTTGVDLMEKLISISNEQGFTVGLLGANEGVAEKTKECLLRKYPKLKVSFAQSGGRVNAQGEMMEEGVLDKYKADILFVAFGQGKQEKWIKKYMNKVNAKVFIGVGGAFDYLSGEVRRAPKWMRALGLEWLFRGLRQPWRLKRFGALIRFVFMVF